jgi:hypothetical protein
MQAHGQKPTAVVVLVTGCSAVRGPLAPEAADPTGNTPAGAGGLAAAQQPAGAPSTNGPGGWGLSLSEVAEARMFGAPQPDMGRTDA